ncbi:MAG: hypothetical protein ACXIUZ_01865 [Lysobacteraceae bacterium]
MKASSHATRYVGGHVQHLIDQGAVQIALKRDTAGPSGRWTVTAHFPRPEDIKKETPSDA